MKQYKRWSYCSTELLKVADVQTFICTKFSRICVYIVLLSAKREKQAIFDSPVKFVKASEEDTQYLKKKIIINPNKSITFHPKNNQNTYIHTQLSEAGKPSVYQEKKNIYNG